MVIPIALLVLALSAALLRPRSAGAYWLLLAVLVLLMGGNLDNADRQAYLDNYVGLLSGNFDANFEPGYQLLVRVFAGIGLPYEAFTFCIAFAGLMLFGATVRQFSERPSLVLAMYTAYPMFWDYVQVRNFLAMSMLVYGARHLIGRRKSKMRYTLWVAVASSFHISSVIFLVMPLACIRRSRIFYVVSALAVAVYLRVLEILFANPPAFLVNKIQIYTVTETSATTKAGVILLYLVTVALVGWCGHIVNSAQVHSMTLSGASPIRRPPRARRVGHHRRAVERIDTTVVFRMFLLSGVFLPLATINLDFMRLFRNMFLVSCLLFVVALGAARRRTTVLALGGGIGLYLAVCFFGLVFFLSFTDIISPLFSSHLLSTD